MLNTAPLTNLAKAGTEETPTATIKLNKSGPNTETTANANKIIYRIKTTKENETYSL